MASDYLTEIRSAQPNGPYALYGYSMGGPVSYEIAQQIVAAGETVSLLALGDCDVYTELSPLRAYVWPILIREILRLDEDPEEYIKMSVHKRIDRLVRMAIDAGSFPAEADVAVLKRMLEMYDINAGVVAAYKVRPYPGKVVLLRSDQPSHLDDTLGWPPYVDELIVHRVPGTHHGMMDPENASCIAQVLDLYLGAPVMEGRPVTLQRATNVDRRGTYGIHLLTRGAVASGNDARRRQASPDADRDVSREAMGGGARC